jgi:putative AlgH/UPF0301 family transcriptional regulator
MNARNGIIAAMLALGALAAAATPPPEPDINAGAVFLVATPKLDGAPYEGAVIVAAPTPAGGHVGVVLNRPLQQRLGEIFPDFAPAAAVTDVTFAGGAMWRNVIVAMARSPSAPSKRSVAVMEGIWLVFDAPAIDRLVEVRPNMARYYAGVVIWRPGQLAAEIDEGLLSVASAELGELFLQDTSKLHEATAARAHRRQQKCAPGPKGGCA